VVGASGGWADGTEKRRGENRAQKNGLCILSEGAPFVKEVGVATAWNAAAREGSARITATDAELNRSDGLEKDTK
jgi:hypothetical protein